MIGERTLRHFLSTTLLAAGIVGCGSSGAADRDAGGTSDAEGQDGTVGGDANGGSDAPAGGDTNEGSDAPLGGDTSSLQDSAAGCPSSAPGAGSPCPAAGAYCSYGGGICCGGAYTCATGGTWQVLEATCACNLPATDAGGPCGVTLARGNELLRAARMRLLHTQHERRPVPVHLRQGLARQWCLPGNLQDDGGLQFVSAEVIRRLVMRQRNLPVPGLTGSEHAWFRPQVSTSRDRSCSRRLPPLRIRRQRRSPDLAPRRIARHRSRGTPERRARQGPPRGRTV